ncbi:MAG TPA: hypothetical protein VLE99_04065 [Candidatus Saccharimonadales bacterium]|nr:hypothetical protein [Candidatus Saccharimonadales bacterium]
MSEKNGSQEIYSDLTTLVGYGLREQHRINQLTDREEAGQAMNELVGQLTTAWAGVHQPVHIWGDRVSAVPCLSPDVDEEVLEVGYGIAHVVSECEEQTGVSFGFAAMWIPSVGNDGAPTQRLVLCHMIDTGEQRLALDEEHNLVTTRVMTYFTMESSHLMLLDDTRAHNIAALRRSDAEVYTALDIIIHDETTNLEQKLSRLHRCLQQGGFDALPHTGQAEILSYLNSCELFVAPRIMRFEYGLVDEDGTSATIVPMGRHVGVAFHGFVASAYARLRTAFNGTQYADHVGDGVGMRVTVYEEDEHRRDMVVPLNQRIRTLGDRLPPVVARLALARAA